MTKIQNWASHNIDAIQNCFKEKRYNDLLRIYEKYSGLSQVQLAINLKCDRKSVRRYLRGERNVPMGMVPLLLKGMGISYEMISSSISPIKEQDENQNGSLIWLGNSETLLNTIYFYRTKQWHLSRFELACKLNINESLLFDYEHGRKRIPPTVVEALLNNCGLNLTDIFPCLVSYDGGKTYMQLDIRSSYQFGDKQYNLYEDELYVFENGEPVDNFLPFWPTWRYDDHAKPLLKYMPDELTIDEYYNTDSLYFWKGFDIDNGNEEFYEYDPSNKKLPPCYQFIQDFYDQKNFQKNTRSFNIRIQRFKFMPDYMVKFIYGKKENIFDLKSYIFSDSPWYQLLQNKDYFYKGILENVDDPYNSCLRWPDGQYIRIIELYIEKYKYRYFKRAKFIGRNSWLIYEE